MINQRFALFLCLLIAVAIGAAASTHVQNTASYAWPDIADHGPASAFSNATILSLHDDHVLIWHPLDNPAPLTFESLAAARSIPIISYDDVHPHRWQAVYIGEKYHLTWQETGGLLRSALIQTDGNTIRGPVELSTGIGNDVITLPAPNGHALVLWTTSNTNAQLASLILDPDGRPGPITIHPVHRVKHVDAVRDMEQRLHVAWLTSPTPDTYAIHYHHTADETLTIDDATTLHTFPLVPDAAISSFALGLDHTFGYVVLGITSAVQPDKERIEIIAFPLRQPQTITHSVLELPATIQVSATTLESALVTGAIAVLQPDAPATALRWPRVASGQHDTMVLALAIKADNDWQPGIVYFQDGTPRGYQIITAQPANAGPPQIHITDGHNLLLTWLGLQDTVPHRYTAFTAGIGWSTVTISRANLLARTLAGIGVGIPLGLLWPALPTLLLLFTPSNAWTPVLFCTVYSAAKLLWPPDLFAQLPPLLAINPLENVGAATVVGGTVTLIMWLAGISALVICRSSGSRWFAWSTFIVIDMVLTWIVFGATLAP